ncbi:MAG: hypothetical protein V4581_06835 [Bacteroidota bacterium]
MKKLLIAFIVLFSQVLLAQDAQVDVNTENLCKKWIFKDIINTEKSEADVAETREMLLPTIFQLNQDGTYIFEFIDTRKGTWQLDAAKKVITLKESGKFATHTWTVHSLTKNELSASRDDASQKIVFTAP